MGRTVSELVSSRVSNTISNVKIWGGIIYNVKEFGAKGDGKKNDTTAIQKAIDAVDEHGGGVFFPPGTYLVSKLNINHDVRLFSYGGAVIKQIPLIDDSMIVVSGTGLTINFENIVFDGNNALQEQNSRNNIIIIHASGEVDNPFIVKFEDCEFRDQCYSSINFYGDFIQSGYEHLYVNRCRFFGGNEGTSSSYDPRYISINDASRATITSCIFDLQRTPEDYGICGIAVASTDSINVAYGSLTIFNNEFYKVGRKATNSLGTIEYYIYSADVIIMGNKIYDSPSGGIRGKSDSKNLIIANNILNGCGMDSISVVAAVTGASEKNFSISHNIIMNGTGNGITLEPLSTDPLEDVLIADNIIDTVTQRGIYVNFVKNLSIRGNSVKNVGLTGITVHNSEGMTTISENQISNAGAYGVYVITGVSGIKLICNNNNFEMVTSFAMNVEGVKDATFIGNIGENNAIGTFIRVNTIEKATVIGNIADNFGTNINATSVTTLKEGFNSWNA